MSSLNHDAFSIPVDVLRELSIGFALPSLGFLLDGLALAAHMRFAALARLCLLETLRHLFY